MNGKTEIDWYIFVFPGLLTILAVCYNGRNREDIKKQPRADRQTDRPNYNTINTTNMIVDTIIQNSILL